MDVPEADAGYPRRRRNDAAAAIVQSAASAAGGQRVAADSAITNSVHGDAVPPAAEGGHSASSHSARNLDPEGGQ